MTVQGDRNGSSSPARPAKKIRNEQEPAAAVDETTRSLPLADAVTQ